MALWRGVVLWRARSNHCAKFVPPGARGGRLGSPSGGGHRLRAFPSTWPGKPMRVYLPATLSGLAGLLHKAEIGPAPLRAFAVTPALREWYASGDLEELEYVAMMHAARASLRLLLADPEAPRRRGVLPPALPDQQVATP